jgi:Mycothiol maleylpyruvate isomerase N-terminal domain
MKDRLEELAEKERAAWVGFLSVVESVPADRRASEGVVPGWSVKDLVWHCAEWARFAGEHLEQMKRGTFVDPFEGVDPTHWDEVSQQMIDQSREMTWDEVLAGAEGRRVAVRDIWSTIDPIDDAAEHWFAEETFIHYDEHAEEIRRFLDAKA